MKSLRAVADAWDALTQQEKDAYAPDADAVPQGSDALSDTLARLSEARVPPEDTPWQAGDKQGPLTESSLKEVGNAIQEHHARWVQLVGQKISSSGPAAPEARPSAARVRLKLPSVLLRI